MVGDDDDDDDDSRQTAAPRRFVQFGRFFVSPARRDGNGRRGPRTRRRHEDTMSGCEPGERVPVMNAITGC